MAKLPQNTPTIEQPFSNGRLSGILGTGLALFLFKEGTEALNEEMWDAQLGPDLAEAEE